MTKQETGQSAHKQERPAFTPGPWSACKGNYPKKDGHTLCVCGQVRSRHHTIATVHRPEQAEDMLDEEAFVSDSHQAEANARLVAAAPEMYEALESIVSMADDGTIIESEPSHVAPIMLDRARRALRRARGEGE